MPFFNLDQLDEAIPERLQFRAELGSEKPDRGAQDQGYDYLAEQALEEFWFFDGSCGNRGSVYDKCDFHWIDHQ